jgi:transposase
VKCAGIEGTSSYGAGLTRHLKAQGIEVLEVERPKRQQRSSRRNLKSDPSDAESAARAGNNRPAKRRACPRRVVRAVWR